MPIGQARPEGIDYSMTVFFCTLSVQTQRMKNRHFVFMFFLATYSLFAQKGVITIAGMVTTDQGSPISNVNVLVKGTSNGSKTNRSGTYSIMTKPKDILVFSHLGMQTVEIRVKGGTTTVNIQMLSQVEELDEVVVKKKRAFAQKELLAEYPTNKSLIKTSWGIINKDRLPYSIRIIDGKDLIPVGPDFLTSLKDFYPQMRVIRNPDVEPTSINPKVYLQSWSWSAKPTAIFDVDGFIYEQPPTFLSANDIDRVAILVRNGAFVRYGPAGAGGVIIINTKSQTWMDDMAVERTYDNSGLRDSLVDVLNRKEVLIESIPDYIKKLNTTASESEALKIFENLHERHDNSPYYFLEVSDYFRKQWSDTKKAEDLLHFVSEKFPQDVSALKVIAFLYEENEQFEKALGIHLKILKLRSRDAQSHRDVANAYTEISNYHKALSVYARYELAVNELDTIPFDAYGTDLLMTTESENIIILRGKELSINKKVLENSTESPNTRLVFEWSNDQAEFELQIVDPENYYDDWSNSLENMEPLVRHEKLKGYSSKQFFLDDSLKGEWQVNINYFGNQTKAPTYLKITTYFDYGKPSQRRKLKIVKLTEQHRGTQLFSINTEIKTVNF